MGLVFQMVDDLMDVIGISDKAQKTLKSNLSEGTVTLPMIHAYTLHPHHEGLRKLAQAEKLSRAERSSLHRLLATREVIELCRATMDEYAEKATESLKQMPANIYRAGLQDLFDYVRQCSWGGLDEKLAVGDASKLHA
jgi:geranylgeranyl pyrophosphate synthase